MHSFDSRFTGKELQIAFDKTITQKYFAFQVALENLKSLHTIVASILPTCISPYFDLNTELKGQYDSMRLT